MNNTRTRPVPAPGHRPQRVLTEDEWKTVWATATLNLHGALILGIVDPVPSPSPMSEDEGAWVRAHVWPAFLTKLDNRYPHGFVRWSTCEKGTCWNCLVAGRCDLCVHRQEGGPHVDRNVDWMYNPQGRAVATSLIRPDDTPCVWWCRCPCPKTNAAPGSAESGARTDATEDGVEGVLF